MDVRQRGTARFDVPARPEAVREARERVRKTLTDWGFGAVTDELIVCLSEALTNSITHALNGDTVTVRAWRDGALVRVEVVDCDRRPPQPEVPTEVALPDPPPPDHQLEEHGRGLFLIEALSSRWGVESKPPGKCVWFEKDAQPEPLIGVAG
jgi:anti-sigma regulatory factor (Ser/Thr protein kinase)